MVTAALHDVTERLARDLGYDELFTGTSVPGEMLLDFETIWAAGGTPNAVFCLQPDDLVRLTGGAVAAIAQ